MSVFVGELTPSGTVTITGMSSQPQMVLFTGTNQTAFETIINSGNRGGFLGFASHDEFESDTIVNYCVNALMAGSNGASSMSEDACYTQTAQGSYGTNILYRGSVTSFQDDGFTIAFDVGSGSHKVFYMALCGMEGSAAWQYRRDCDGILATDIGVEPSFLVALGQYRGGACHTLPISVSVLPWCSGGFADIAGGDNPLNGEYMYQTYAKHSLNQRWSNAVNLSSANAQVGAENRPGPLGTVVPLGTIEATRSGTSVVLDGRPGGYDWVVGALSAICTRMDVDVVGAGVEGGEQTFDLGQIGGPAEAAVFINMEFQPAVASNTPGRWGFGFATPLYECSWLIDRSSGAMLQSTTYSWISSVTPSAFSAGTTDFVPPTDDIGFVTVENGGGTGASGFGAIRTYCDVTAPLLVSFSGFYENRPSGSQITTRGAPFNEGEGVPGHLERS